jgi:hypothetical protein
MSFDGTGFGRRRGLALLALAALGGAGAAGWRAAASTEAEPGLCDDRCGGLVAGWSETAEVVLARLPPEQAGRALAMMHLAMHDAVNAALPRFTTYALAGRDGGADAAVAAAAAAHDLLLALVPAEAERLAAALAESLAEAVPEAEAARGRRLGADAARAILAARAGDGADRRIETARATHLGAWRPTGGTAAMDAAHWARVRPFALRSPSQFRVPAPPSVESAAYAQAVAEVQALGGGRSNRRTAEQAAIARAWAGAPEIAWNRIARGVARERALDLWDSARLFALLNVALADARIAAWESKLHHDLWRPETAIRLARDDFNPRTTADPGWTPLLPVPAAPAHASAHAAQAAAAALVLGRLLGDGVPFTLDGRGFTGFPDAALEAAESRILAGAQFRFGVADGLDLGEQVGRTALQGRLRPLTPRSTA